jgi:chondroitin sulfate synthase
MKKRNATKASKKLTILGAFMGFLVAFILHVIIFDCRNSHIKGHYKLDSYPNPNLKENIFDNNYVEPRKRLVFVGVMTAQKYLDTRAKSVYETWGRNIPGKISFFSRSGSSSAYDIPLVSLPGVDDSYPPQKKSFMMLKFMHDNYLEKFEWFMRVDDDIYIKPDKLELFLRSLNSSKPQFIGQPGLGTIKELGKLSLDYGENFCMGDSGIIMSRKTLRLIVPHIKECLKNLYTTHDDVEIGRCIHQYTNTSCTWSYEVS